MLAFAEADLQIAMGRYDEHIRHAAVPPPNPGQRLQDPQHVLFGALRAQPGSFEDNVLRGGGLSFLAGKFREGFLFGIRNFKTWYPPMPTSHAIHVIQDCLKSLLVLCVQFPCRPVSKLPLSLRKRPSLTSLLVLSATRPSLLTPLRHPDRPCGASTKTAQGLKVLEY